MDTAAFHQIIADLKWMFDTLEWTPYLMAMLFIGVVYSFYKKFFASKD